MLDQKADFLKIQLKLVNARSRTKIQKCQWNQSTKRISQLKISLSFVRKHLYSIKDIIAVTAYVIVDVLSLSRPFQQQP